MQNQIEWLTLDSAITVARSHHFCSRTDPRLNLRQAVQSYTCGGVSLSEDRGETRQQFLGGQTFWIWNRVVQCNLYRLHRSVVFRVYRHCSVSVWWDRLPPRCGFFQCHLASQESFWNQVPRRRGQRIPGSSFLPETMGKSVETMESKYLWLIITATAHYKSRQCIFKPWNSRKMLPTKFGLPPFRDMTRDRGVPAMTPVAWPLWQETLHPIPRQRATKAEAGCGVWEFPSWWAQLNCRHEYLMGKMEHVEYLQLELKQMKRIGQVWTLKRIEIRKQDSSQRWKVQTDGELAFPAVPQCW